MQPKIENYILKKKHTHTRVKEGWGVYSGWIGDVLSPRGVWLKLNVGGPSHESLKAAERVAFHLISVHPPILLRVDLHQLLIGNQLIQIERKEGKN